MTLGEFRKLTETLPDDAQLVVEALINTVPEVAGVEEVTIFKEKSLVKNETRFESKSDNNCYFYAWNKDDFDLEKNMVVIESEFYVNPEDEDW